MKVIFKCKNCNKEKEVFSKVGSKTEAPTCEECNCVMSRQFKNVTKGDIVDDELIDAAQKMIFKN